MHLNKFYPIFPGFSLLFNNKLLKHPERCDTRVNVFPPCFCSWQHQKSLHYVHRLTAVCFSNITPNLFKVIQAKLKNACTNCLWRYSNVLKHIFLCNFHDKSGNLQKILICFVKLSLKSFDRHADSVFMLIDNHHLW